MRHADRDRHLKIVVAALTRRRPDMLKALLDSLVASDLPEQVDVKFLIVENDENPSSVEILRAFGEKSPERAFLYIHEPELGIPIARNRAAREAIALGADLLVFVDDDEVVARDWLVHLVTAYRDSKALVIGGPVGIEKTSTPLTRTEALIEDGITRRYRSKERRAARLANLDGTPGVTIVTNNWLAATEVFTKHGIWFDETMRFTGGSDARFCADVKAADLPTAWAAKARVFERIPLERLSFAYQFRRARQQARSHYTRKKRGVGTALLNLLLLVPARAIGFVFLCLTVPLTAGRTLLAALRSGGWLVGRLEAIGGKQSDLYQPAPED